MQKPKDSCQTSAQTCEDIEWVVLYECRQESEVATAQAVLSAANIQTAIHDQFMAQNEPWLRFTGIVPTKILVPADDVERARALFIESGLINPNRTAQTISAPLALKLLWLVGGLYFLWAIFQTAWR